MTNSYTNIGLHSVRYEKVLIDEGFYIAKFIVREYPDEMQRTCYELQKEIEKLIAEKFQQKIEEVG